MKDWSQQWDPSNHDRKKPAISWNPKCVHDSRKNVRMEKYNFGGL